MTSERTERVDRVAVLADVHGVLPALEAVLAEPDVRAADRIVLAGDLAAGPLPVATLDLLAGLGERAVWVSGNADRELVEYRRGGRTAIPDPIAPWAAEQLRAGQVELLEGLPARAELEIAGLGRVVFCHATPRDDEEVVLVDSRPARWAEVLAGLRPEVTAVVCGHTHMPYARLTHGRLAVNPGSVGMPYGRPGAHWALLGPGDAVSLRRTAYDYAAACDRIAADSGYADAAAWADEYVWARNSAEDALTALGRVSRITVDQPAASDAVHGKAEDRSSYLSYSRDATTQPGAVAGVVGPRGSEKHGLGPRDGRGDTGPAEAHGV